MLTALVFNYTTTHWLLDIKQHHIRMGKQAHQSKSRALEFCGPKKETDPSKRMWNRRQNKQPMKVSSRAFRSPTLKVAGRLLPRYVEMHFPGTYSNDRKPGCKVRHWRVFLRASSGGSSAPPGFSLSPLPVLRKASSTFHQDPLFPRQGLRGCLLPFSSFGTG